MIAFVYSQLSQEQQRKRWEEQEYLGAIKPPLDYITHLSTVSGELRCSLLTSRGQMFGSQFAMSSNSLRTVLPRFRTSRQCRLQAKSSCLIGVLGLLRLQVERTLAQR